jgi:DNA-binding SARP family transcriptional activator
MGDGSDSNRPRSERGSPTLTLRLLGGFELRAARGPRQVPLSSQRLLAYLALNEGPRPRAQVAGTLWSDASEVRANASLRSALWRLRRASPSVVVVRGDHLSVSACVTVDARELIRLAHQAIRQSIVEDGEADQILLQTGELLPGWFEDWVLIERERLRQLRLHALESACTQLIAVGNLSTAVEIGLAAVAAEPLRESAHVVLARAFLAEGNRCEAVLDFRRFRELLADELGIGPSASFARLVGETRRRGNAILPSGSRRT